MVAQATPLRQSAFERALARAQEEGTQTYWSDNEKAWYASSTSRPFTWHRVDPIAGTCDCEAGQRGLYCKHQAAVFAARLQPCSHCGHIGDTVVRHVRIHSERYEYVPQCRDRSACWQRWAESQAKGA